jgi:hypothetical protein
MCPVHGVKMKSTKLRVVYGMPSKQEFEEMRIGKSLFPYGRDYVLAGCVVRPEKFRKGFICPECVKARNRWIASKDRWNEISRVSQAALEEFFVIVNSRDVNEAMKSMAQVMINTPEKRKGWRNQLAAIRSIHVLGVEPTRTQEWKDNLHIFKVTLEVLAENPANAPIPFYGWGDNPNVRWVTMKLNNQRRWIIAEIATGP